MIYNPAFLNTIASAFIMPHVVYKFPSHQLIKVFGEDSHSRSVWVSRGATTREVCHMLVQSAHCSDQESWALLEVHPTLGLGKTLGPTENPLLCAAAAAAKKKNDS